MVGSWLIPFSKLMLEIFSPHPPSKNSPRRNSHDCNHTRHFPKPALKKVVKALKVVSARKNLPHLLHLLYRLFSGRFEKLSAF
jgi:hypothetical protein